MALVDTDGRIIEVVRGEASPEGAVCTIPHIVGGEKIEASPIYLDQMPHTRSLYAEVGGPVTVEVWWTPKVSNPVNWAAIVTAIQDETPIPAYDMTNFDNTWEMVTRLALPEGRYVPFDEGLVRFLKRFRWCRLIRTHGTTPITPGGSDYYKIHHVISSQ